jgi:hypothetical protein
MLNRMGIQTLTDYVSPTDDLAVHAVERKIFI